MTGTTASTSPSTTPGRRRGRFARQAAYVTYGSFALAGAVIVGSAWTMPWAPERELWLARATGWAAVTALMLALVATPASRLLRFATSRHVPTARITTLRRSFGVASAWLAAIHGAWTFFVYLDASWSAVSYWPYLRAGVAALAILLALLATSYPRIVRGLRIRLWKPLHRLAYVAAILVFQHLLLAPLAPKRLVFGLFAALAAVQLMRFLPRRAG